MGIHLKLFAIQQQLKAPKDQINNFGNYKYRSCEQVLEALKPSLQATSTFVTLSDAIEEVGGRIYVKATATITDIESGESLSVTAFAREEETKKGMDTSQITGAASSYARKYALSGLFAIDDNKDSDATNVGDTKLKDPKPQQPKTVEQYLQHDDKGDFAVCADCNGFIRDIKQKNGTVFTVRDYLKKSLELYDRPVCKACINGGKTS